MRAHETDLVYVHTRIELSPVIAPEIFVRGEKSLSGIINFWANSNEDCSILKSASGCQVCLASSGDVCIMTVWNDSANALAIKTAHRSYFDQSDNL